VNHAKTLVNKRTKNHINGIEGFWSFAKHILYNYRVVSKYHFSMYLKGSGVPLQPSRRQFIQTIHEYLFWLRFTLITKKKEQIEKMMEFVVTEH